MINLNAEDDWGLALKEFYEELFALNELDHPNICKLKKFSDFAQVKANHQHVQNVAYIAMEYDEEGDLFKCLMNSGKFSEDEARYYFSQLIHTLEYMHNKGYYHRDIKPENIMLDSNFNLKIADFGFATKMETCTKRRGTLKYMAPEMIENKVYKSKDADLFAAAVTLFNLVTKRVPFNQSDVCDGYYRYIIKRNDSYYWRLQGDDTMSEAFKDLFLKMVSYDPTSRLTIKDIKNHPWFKGTLLSQEEMYQRMCIRMKKNRTNSFKTVKTSEARKRSFSTRNSNPTKKHSQIYFDKNGDEIVNALVDALKTKGHTYSKSKDFYQVQLVSGAGCDQSKIIISVVNMKNW